MRFNPSRGRRTIVGREPRKRVSHEAFVNSEGAAVIIGDTASTDFPISTDAFQSVNQARVYNPPTNAFVTKLSATGALVYSTYLGGSVGQDDISPAWSPDGTKLAFIRFLPCCSDIFVVNADDSNARQLTNSPVGDFYPAWSPDGTKIAFTFNGGTFVINVDGTNHATTTCSLTGE